MPIPDSSLNHDSNPDSRSDSSLNLDIPTIPDIPDTIPYKDILLTLANNPIPLYAILKQYGLMPYQWHRLVKTHGQLNALYASAREMQAHAYNSASVELWRDMPTDDRLYTIDKNGHKMLSTSGAQYLRNKSDQLNRFASMAEARSYIAKQRIERRELKAIVQATLQAKDIASADVSQLMQSATGQALTLQDND